MKNAVEQTATLIALDIARDIPKGSATAMPVLQDGKRFTVPAQQFQLSPDSVYTYFSLPGKLIAVSNEADELRVYQFAPCRQYC